MYQFSGDLDPIDNGGAWTRRTILNFWFSVMMAAKDARNAIYMERIGTTPC
jgi:hypothetical protein